MSLAQAGIAEAFAESLDEFGDTITIKGQSIKCLVSKDSMDSALEDGGYAVTGALTVRVRLSALADPKPTHNDPVVIGGQRYKIAEITQDPGALIVKYRATRR
jgi:hypothetical protein